MKWIAYLSPYLIIFLCLSCASPLHVEDVAFRTPNSYSNYKTIDGLDIAINPITSKSRLKEFFGTDLKEAGILPVQLIVENKGGNEIEINYRQVFAISNDNTYRVAQTLSTTAKNARKSSIGQTAATGAVTGALVGTAVGAGIGAGVGSAYDEIGEGAKSGAIVGGTTGAATGMGQGLSDSITMKFKKQLAKHAFGDRVIYPGDIRQGFIYFRWIPYKKIRIKLFNITENKNKEIFMPVNIIR